MTCKNYTYVVADVKRDAMRNVRGMTFPLCPDIAKTTKANTVHPECQVGICPARGVDPPFSPNAKVNVIQPGGNLGVKHLKLK